MTMRLAGDRLSLVIRAGSSRDRRRDRRRARRDRRAAGGDRSAALASLIIQQTGSTSDATHARNSVQSEAAAARAARAGAGRRSERSARRSARRFSLLAPLPGCAEAGQMACEREMTRAAAATGVPLNVLYSVGLTETGRRGELEPL